MVRIYNYVYVHCKIIVKVFLHLFIDRPSERENVLVQYTRIPNFISISWTANTIMGVKQNYTITFDTYVAEITQLHYIHHLNTSNIRCGTFLAYVKAVNGAGESNPSSNVSIPSLPDIGPVTASLIQQVWKYDGEIKVNISLEVSTYTGLIQNGKVLSYPLII